MFEMTSNRSLLRAMMLYYVCMITAHSGHNITIFLIGASFFKPLHILYVLCTASDYVISTKAKLVKASQQCMTSVLIHVKFMHVQCSV